MVGCFALLCFVLCFILLAFRCFFCYWGVRWVARGVGVEGWGGGGVFVFVFCVVLFCVLSCFVLLSLTFFVCLPAYLCACLSMFARLFHPRRRNMNTSIVGLDKNKNKNGHIRKKISPKIVNPRDLAGERRRRNKKKLVSLSVRLVVYVSLFNVGPVCVCREQ